ncbi:T9SS type A sorting domain-containing protein [Mangrovimonas aestuarii]|uniref:T9SS type A sorting domain-containing protein n=1 Tax=Mangrovimonas aestuarii TaxID=3018443 RepID=UPI002378B069|nr:T9SS type A sorting domain-containing protein [Mangrovimonas aestuarii]
MKTKLLFLCLLTAFALQAQTEHFIDWELNVNGAAASLTIDVGDTVTWTVTDAIPHTVTSLSGSTQVFDSGNMNPGDTYSVVFNTEGENDYQCNYHQSTMFGTITVQGTMGIEDRHYSDFTISPNPVRNTLNLELPGNMDNTSVEIYDVLGKLVHSQFLGSSSQAELNVSSWNKGVYIVRLMSNDKVTTKRFIKQ